MLYHACVANLSAALSGDGQSSTGWKREAAEQSVATPAIHTIYPNGCLGGPRHLMANAYIAESLDIAFGIQEAPSPRTHRDLARADGRWP